MLVLLELTQAYGLGQAGHSTEKSLSGNMTRLFYVIFVLFISGRV